MPNLGLKHLISMRAMWKLQTVKILLTDHYILMLIKANSTCGCMSQKGKLKLLSCSVAARPKAEHFLSQSPNNK